MANKPSLRRWLMQYADSDYYKNTYHGSTIPDEYLDYYLTKASEKIDSLTYNRIVYMNYHHIELTPFQLEKLQRACCMCAEGYYKDNVDDASGIDNITSYSVLDITVAVDNKNDAAYKIKNNYGINEDTYNCLKQTGLMCGVI